MNAIHNLILTTAIAAILTPAVQAGHPIAPAGKDTKATAPVREWFPDEPIGTITLGTQFSEHLSGVYLDSITGIWSPQQRDAFLFLDSRYHYEDNGQFISSTGIGFRKMLPGREVILGVNAFYDAIHSERDNDFNQLGLGAEVLTKWVDFRFNYYLPENDEVLVDRKTVRNTKRTTGAGFVRTTKTSEHFERLEVALEGFNAEIGFNLPICKHTEVRLYGGYYHYDNPFGGDFNGFKARLEARVLRGVVANVEYWDDDYLMGGHWTASVSASVPFSIYNLVTGRNPFEGAAESFKTGRREFKERMGEIIERSHRIQTLTSDYLPTDTTRSSNTTYSSPKISGGFGILE